MSDQHPILVTGAAGRVGAIGPIVTRLLLERGRSVRAVVHREDDRAQALRDLGAEVVVGDVLDLHSLHRGIEGCDTVYFSMSVSADYLAGSVNAAAVAKYYGVKVFVNISQMTLALRTYRYCRHMQTYRRPGTFSPEGKLLSQTMWASSANFYQAAPANYYAKFWHDNAVNGKAYGFPYDDVGGYSSYISHNGPQYMLVAIGW